MTENVVCTKIKVLSGWILKKKYLTEKPQYRFLSDVPTVDLKEDVRVKVTKMLSDIDYIYETKTSEFNKG